MENERSYIGDAVEAAMKTKAVLFHIWMIKNKHPIGDDVGDQYDDFDKEVKKQLSKSDRKTINDF